MFVIKMKTLIYYFAVIVIVCATIGIVKIQHSEISHQTTAVIIENPTDTKPVDSTVEPLAPEEKFDVPILMYHSVLKNGKDGEKYIIADSAFEKDLKYLSEKGYTTVVIQDLIDYVHKGKPLPEKPIVLTFDDGYFNNYSYVFPLLQKYNAKAVISIIGYYTDLYTDSPDENPQYSHITWQNINDMSNSGLVEFQNHSYNLHTNNKGRNGSKRKSGETLSEYRKLLTDDLGKLQEQFKNYTGYVPNTYTYPFGSVSNDSFDIIKEIGFKASLSCQEGINQISRDPECLYMLKRYLRTPDKSAEKILNN